LVVDCTKVGLNFRLLTISLCYRRRTLPLVWSVHRGSRGHVTVEEQLALFRAVRHLIPIQSEVWVLGDTGFQTVPLVMKWDYCCVPCFSMSPSRAAYCSLPNYDSSVGFV
jgi:hypothetical protein